MQDLAVQYSQSVKSVTSLLAHLKSSSEQEAWLLEVLKRRCGISHGRAAEIRKAVSKGVSFESSRMESGITSTLKVLLKHLGDESADQASFESYLRANLLSVLERNQKHREHKLKKRTKTLLEYLSRLESAEKAYTRALTDLQYEKRKFADLEERRRLNRAEEIEKVEIDLRRVRSNLGVKQAEFDMAKSKMEDVQKIWLGEWDGFRLYARQVELDRCVEIRKCLTEACRAELLVKEAEIQREQALLSRLEQIDIPPDLARLTSFEGLPPHSTSISSAQSVHSIATQIWPASLSRPGGCLTAAQAASLSLPLSSTGSRPRPGVLQLPERASSRSSNESGSPISRSMDSPAAMSFGSCGTETASIAGTPTKVSPREYGEEMFRVRRKAVPAEHGIKLDEFGNLKSVSADSLSSTSSSMLGHRNLAAFPTPRKASKPLPGIPASRLFDDDLTGSPSESEPSPAESASDEGEEGDDTISDLPDNKEERARVRKKEVRKSAPPTLPSFTNLKLAELDWSLEGQDATVVA